MLDLRTAFLNNNCDKIDHHYHMVYEDHFSKVRENKLKVLEIGIWKGNSIRALTQYFPSADLYGIDIFDRIKPEQVSVLQKDNVHWIEGDSTNPDISDRVKKEFGGQIKFDIIIDDGKHTPKANMLSFQNLSGFLKRDGVYYIEDVWPIHKMSDKQIESNGWFLNNPGEYTREYYAEFLDAISGWKQQHFDYRSMRRPENPFLDDSYIIRLTR